MNIQVVGTQDEIDWFVPRIGHVIGEHVIGTPVPIGDGSAHLRVHLVTTDTRGPGEQRA